MMSNQDPIEIYQLLACKENVNPCQLFEPAKTNYRRMLQTRPSYLDSTDTTVVYTPLIDYRHDRRVHDGRVYGPHDRRALLLQTRPSCL